MIISLFNFFMFSEALYYLNGFTSDEVFSLVDRNLLNKVSDELKKHHYTVATAESCTGGLLAHLLTNISGSSEYFDRGVITYSNTAKKDLLNVPQTILDTYGAVSEQTASAMAQGIRTNAGVDIGLSTTGVAGPTGGTKEKPVGLVYIGIATKKNIVVKRFLFTGNRLANKESTCSAALTLIIETLDDMKS
jgi:nicotinamide-nucleotide amidase